MLRLRLPLPPFAFALAATLVACGSAPTHFYTLLPPAEPATAAAAPAAFAIAVEPIGVPAEVDQVQWLVRTGPGQMALLDNERWAAPLGDELRAAFAEELTHQLGARDVYKAANSTGLPVYRIQIDVRRFESAAGGYALIEADWSVARREGAAGASMQCHSRVSQPVEPGYAALALGHQRAVAAIAARITLAVRGVASGAAVCPPPEPA
jgi:uncharacterized lipoprotein YmbA